MYLNYQLKIPFLVLHTLLMMLLGMVMMNIIFGRCRNSAPIVDCCCSLPNLVNVFSQGHSQTTLMKQEGRGVKSPFLFVFLGKAPKNLSNSNSQEAKRVTCILNFAVRISRYPSLVETTLITVQQRVLAPLILKHMQTFLDYL